MDFSRTLAALIASSGSATSMSFLLFFTPCPAMFAPSPLDHEKGSTSRNADSPLAFDPPGT